MFAVKRIVRRRGGGGGGGSRSSITNDEKQFRLVWGCFLTL